MDDAGVILNVMKNIDNYSDFVRYCNTNSKIKRICIQYAPSVFGVSHQDILIILAIKKDFPSLEDHLPIDVLLDTYGSYEAIWGILQSASTHYGEIPMCRTTTFEYTNPEIEDGNGDPIAMDPSNPQNLKWVAPYHRPILSEGGPHRTITFLFFRALNKIPNDIFTMDMQVVITPYHFIQLSEMPNLTNIIDGISRNYITKPEHEDIWEAYINDKMWRNNKYKKYYKNKSLRAEINEAFRSGTCSDHDAHGFKITDISNLFRRHFNIPHPVVEIKFDT